MTSSPKLKPSTILLAFIALTTVTGQSFQYSNGWKNGKRDVHKIIDPEMKEIANNLERALSPCQLNKLKYLLEGQPFTERIFMPCDYNDDDPDPQPKKKYKGRNQEPLFDAFL